MARKHTEADNGSLGPGRSLELGEVGDPGPIEKVSATDFLEEAGLTAFMEEKVRVLVHESNEDGALPVCTPQVNGINQPIIRGVEVVVKRKYVEALARGRTTVIKQQTPDPRNPDGIQTTERTTLTYPFVTINDTSKGKLWLKAILAQP